MSNIFEELRRRKVFRVAAAYVVGAWVLLQVVDVLSPALELPDSTIKFLFYGLLGGFVPALILAWMFEISSSGIKRETARTNVDGEIVAAAGKLEQSIFAITVLALVGGGGYWYSGKDKRWADGEAFPQIRALAQMDDWESAYSLARQVESVLPDDPVLAEMWSEFSRSATIPTDPPGADVYRRAYADTDDEWEYLGTTPL
jgi:hypothetical protein